MGGWGDGRSRGLGMGHPPLIIKLNNEHLAFAEGTPPLRIKVNNDLCILFHNNRMFCSVIVALDNFEESSSGNPSTKWILQIIARRFKCLTIRPCPNIMCYNKMHNQSVIRKLG